MQIVVKKYKCFSLVELMVVISIIGIMSVVAYVSLKAPKNVANVSIAQREVTSAIKLAQSYALQGKMEKTGIGGRLVVPCGYGFRFTTTKDYEIFYNPGPDSFGSMECEKKNNKLDPYASDLSYIHWKNGHSKTAATGSLMSGIALTIPTFDINFNQTEIYFTNPEAQMFNYLGSTFPETTFRLMDPVLTNIFKEIVINPKGGVTEK